MAQAAGFEPASSASESDVLPLNYARGKFAMAQAAGFEPASPTSKASVLPLNYANWEIGLTSGLTFRLVCFGFPAAVRDGVDLVGDGRV